ncbi:hypothetical protein GOODEAATRI_013829, partial [Goodea atripinnis]
NHQERAPCVLKNSQDTLSLEFEAVLTPQLQVAVCMCYSLSHRVTGQKWRTPLCLIFFPRLSTAKKTFCSATCQRFTSSTAGNSACSFSHELIFLQDLQGCLETPERVGACFLQRELLKHCVEEQSRCELQEALDSMLELLKSVNDSMHQIAITGYLDHFSLLFCLGFQGDISQLGRIILQGSFNVWISHKRAAVRMKELARFKPMQRHLFLYEHALLFCKRRDEDSHDSFYSFKSCLRVKSLHLLILVHVVRWCVEQLKVMLREYDK